MKFRGAEQSEKRIFTKGRVAEGKGLEEKGRRREGSEGEGSHEDPQLWRRVAEGDQSMEKGRIGEGSAEGLVQWRRDWAFASLWARTVQSWNWAGLVDLSSKKFLFSLSVEWSSVKEKGIVLVEKDYSLRSERWAVGEEGLKNVHLSLSEDYSCLNRGGLVDLSLDEGSFLIERGLFGEGRGMTILWWDERGIVKFHWARTIRFSMSEEGSLKRWARTIQDSMTKDYSTRNERRNSLKKEFWSVRTQWLKTIHFSFFRECSMTSERWLFIIQWLKNIHWWNELWIVSCSLTKEHSTLIEKRPFAEEMRREQSSFIEKGILIFHWARNCHWRDD